MAVLRQHAVLLDVEEPTPGPHVGAVHHLTPLDADGVADKDQEFVAMVRLERVSLHSVAAGDRQARPNIALSDRRQLRQPALDPPRRHVAWPSRASTRPCGVAPRDAAVRTRDDRAPRAEEFAFVAYVALGSSAPFRDRVVR